MMEWLELTAKILAVVAPMGGGLYWGATKVVGKYAEAQEKIAHLKEKIIIKTMEDHKIILNTSIQDHKMEMIRWIDTVKFLDTRLRDLEVKLEASAKINTQTCDNLSRIVQEIRSDYSKIRQGQALILKHKRGTDG